MTHINVTSEQVVNADGEERFKWMAAGRNLITGAIEALSPDEKEVVKAKARKEGKKYTEPAKGVFTIKPDNGKVRIVACGKKTPDIYGKISTSDLDTAMLRFLLSWGASSSSNAIASLDIIAAFLCRRVGWLY